MASMKFTYRIMHEDEGHKMGKSKVKSSATYLKVRVGEEESARKIQL
jgi:hypothetical protein